MISRSLFFIFIYLPVILVGAPLQFVLTRLGFDWNFLPRLFHSVGCIFLGVRVHVIGAPAHGRPTLLLSNHISWTDIIAIGSKADVTFVAKSGVRDTFFVGFMASLQKTIFIDYNRRQDTKRTSREMVVFSNWVSASSATTTSPVALARPTFRALALPPLGMEITATRGSSRKCERVM